MLPENYVAELKSRVASDICEKFEECYKESNLAKALEFVGKDEELVRFLNRAALYSLAETFQIAIKLNWSDRHTGIFDKFYDDIRDIEDESRDQAYAFAKEAIYEMMRQNLIEDLDEAMKP